MPRNEEFLSGLTFDTHKAEPHEANHSVSATVPGSSGQAGDIKWDQDTGEIFMVHVAGRYQRQGLATELLSQARQFATDTRGVRQPRHSKMRTNDGDSWAQSLDERLPKRAEPLPLDPL